MISVSRSPLRSVRLGVSALSALALVFPALLAGCGGGGSGSGGGGGQTTYTLTVDSANPASGVVIGYSGGSGAVPAQTGTTSFTLTENSGTTINLTAPQTASNGNGFSSWSGCTSTSSNGCTVTLNANTTVTANYATATPTAYTLTVASTNPASGVAITANPADNNSVASGSSQFTLSYNAGTSVTLTAPATSNGNSFSSWTGCTSTSGDACTVTVNANTTVTANYTTPVTPVYTLTVDSTTPASGVAITASPADNNSVSSGNSPLTLTYNAGASVTLTAPATATGGNTFSSWTGCSSTTGDTCTVTVNANTTVTANYTAATAPTAYELLVHVTDPTSGATVTITASPADNNGTTGSAAPFALYYNAGATVTLTAPATDSAGNTFSAWTGCSSTSGDTCTVGSIGAMTTVIATYVVPTPTVSVTPATGSNVTIGQSQQFTANVQNLSNPAVTWSVALASGTGSAGTISASGLYETPYPAPASVTITATSVANTSVKSSVTVNLVTPATAAGPALSADAATVTRPISPLIYGMNAYLLDSNTAKTSNITVARWGGDDTSRYNYQTNVVNSANDYYFENFTGSGGMLGGGLFNNFVSTADGLGISTIGTAPVIGWVSNNKTGSGACSFPKSADPNQQSYDSDNCGNGVDSSGTQLTGNATIAAITSVSEPPPAAPGAGNATISWAQATWTGGWVNCLLTTGSYCTAASGKDVTIWDLDNEPEYWSAVHRDVHPNPMTYDEITNGGIGTALAIKTVDPAAQVSGPIISGWYEYFYSQQDVNNGYGTGPCYQPWSDPADRTAHGGVPLIEYYLQQMAAASSTYGMRLLDYVDIHTYFQGNYNGASVGLTTAGDTGEQQARMNSTRVFWDPSYTDPALPQPNYTTDSNYETTSCTPPPQQGPAIIPMLQNWVAKDYPGTKTSIDEYNFGGLESINGAVTQADILGIFGKYGLDMGVLWPQTNYTSQVPGNMAFAIYRNYDGNDSTFGDSEIQSSTGDQSQLAIYAGVRSSDNAVTVVVINKAYGPLTSTLSLNNLTGGSTSAQVYQYSNANLNAIVSQAAATITPPASGSTTSTLSATFPGQSITLFVIPQ